MATPDQSWWNRRTQVIVLMAGLLVWVGVFYWRTTQQAPAPTPVRAGAPAAPRKAPTKAAAVPTLRLELQDRPLPALSVEGRNLFGSVLPPPPPPRPAPTTTAPPPPDPFIQEARRLRVVAIMQENGQPVAFIADGNDVHNVKKNDVIRSRFLIKDVNDDGAVVSLPNGEKEVRLVLTPSGGGSQR